jgi:hypothetical protein
MIHGPVIGNMDNMEDMLHEEMGNIGGSGVQCAQQ